MVVGELRNAENALAIRLDTANNRTTPDLRRICAQICRATGSEPERFLHEIGSGQAKHRLRCSMLQL